MKTVVMLPTYNERENVRTIIPEILKQDKGIEILVVDDSSPDGTGEIVDELARGNGRIHIIHRRERGRGTAGLAGFKWAIENGYEALIEMDADFSHDPKVIPQFLKEIMEYDVVIGSRYVPGGACEGWSLTRRIISSVANAYVRAILGLKIMDCTGGYKIFRTDVLRSLDLDNYVSDKRIYDGPETLLRISKKGFRVGEIPIKFRERAAGKSKLDANKILRNLINNLRLKVKLGGI
ncbi:MAG: polyprenol monophosphomannose synthase [Candidatus Altiarchaeota archaeon]